MPGQVESIADTATGTRVDGVLRYRDGVVTQTADDVAVEEPLEIRARGRAVVVTMRTPGHDAELAAGFLLGEGVIGGADDILNIEPCDRNEDGNLLNVLLAADVYVDFEKMTRHIFASSSCGLCGRASIEAIRGQFPPIESGLAIDADVLLRLPAAMRSAQATFDRTGGLHAASLFTPAGDLVVLREDVGRHNAVDKVIGHALLHGIDPAGCVLLVSGRVSFEIMQKALAARVPLLAAVSAPSSLAVQFARESGQTLVGFLRDGRMNVYAHPQRVRFAQNASSDV